MADIFPGARVAGGRGRLGRPSCWLLRAAGRRGCWFSYERRPRLRRHRRRTSSGSSAARPGLAAAGRRPGRHAALTSGETTSPRPPPGGDLADSPGGPVKVTTAHRLSMRMRRPDRPAVRPGGAGYGGALGHIGTAAGVLIGGGVICCYVSRDPAVADRGAVREQAASTSRPPGSPLTSGWHVDGSRCGPGTG